MTERYLVGNIIAPWLGKRTPSPNVATATGNRWLDGTSGGSTTNTTYGFYAINGVTPMTYQIIDGGITMAATTATSRGRVMTTPFETTTTQQNVQQYCFRLEPSTSYTFSFKAKGVNILAGSCRCLIKPYQSNGTVNSTHSTTIDEGDTEYQTYTSTFTTASTTAWGAIEITFATAGNVMDVSVKDFQLDTTTPTTRTAVSTPRTTATNRVAVRDMGTALRFDGATGKVLATATGSTLLGGSIAVWFRVSRLPTAGEVNFTLVNNTFTTTDLNGIVIRNTGELAGGTYNGSYTGKTKSGLIIPNHWYLCVYTWDGATPNLYINAVSQSGTTAPILSTNAGVLAIGSATNSTKFFLGVIDEPRIWNRALTATEVANMYFNNTIPRDGLVGEWLFNEASGTTALDSSGNGNDGTITGATYTLDVPLKLRTAI